MPEPDATIKESLVTIKRYLHLIDAQMDQLLLETEGIESFLADDNLVSALWFLSAAVGGVRLQVMSSQAEEAREILNERKDENLFEGGPSDEDPAERPACPRCNSNNTAYQKYSKRIAFLSILVLSFPLPVPKRKWHCQSCGHDWKIEMD